MTPRFIVCKASAGAGKTYTLVRHYIEIAISEEAHIDERFKHILAITFTNKAANGMKQRIMQKLQQIVDSDSDADDLVEDMSKHLAVSHETVRLRCGQLRKAILHNYSDFAVCTIDSFVHRIVRTFAHDLHLPMNFNVMIDDSELVNSAVESLMALSGKAGEEALTKVLCGFMESRMEEGGSFDIEKELVGVAGELLKEDASTFLNEIAGMDFDTFLSARDKLRHDNAMFSKAVSDAASKVIEACSREQLSTESFMYGRSGVYPYFARLASGDMSRINDIFANVNKCIDNETLYRKGTPLEVSEAIDRIAPVIYDSYRQIELLKEKHLKEYNTRNYLLVNIFSIALLGRIQALKNDYYDENGIVHISEFNKSIAEKVCDEPAPFIYERIGSRYHNYLIDEFQDTSKLQWLNFLPLLDEAMSHRFGSDSPTSLPPVASQSLVVGDGKQAIYRFRQGDVRQFIKLPKVDSDIHGLSLERNAEIVPMIMNYRTLGEVVKFNNTFFEKTVNHFFGTNDEILDLYIRKDLLPGQNAALEQRWKKDGGYVDIGFVPHEEWLESIRSIVRRQVDELGYSYGDIMVLARTNKTLAAIGNYLMDSSRGEPVPVVSAESFVLQGSRVVLLLCSALKYIVDQGCRPAAVQVVQLWAEIYNMQSGEIDSMLWKLKNEKYNLRDALKDWDLDFNVDYLRSLSVYDCCEELLRRLRLGGMDTAYVSAFLGQVYSYSQRDNSFSNPERFIEYINGIISKRSASTSGDLDAVSLMSIHKAKGLENKIVILAIPSSGNRENSIWVKCPQEAALPVPVTYIGMNKNMKKSFFDDEVDEERDMRNMDELNVLYVALTRPEHKLFVCCDEKANDLATEMLRWYIGGEENTADSASFGTDHPKPQSTGQPEKEGGQKVRELQLDDVSFPSWEDRIMIAPPERARLYMSDSPRRQGVVIHSLMSSIATADDVEPVVADYCKMNGLPYDMNASLTARIRTMIDKPENRPFFMPGLRLACESPVMVGGNVKIPDRIVFGDEETWVIDFKTGEYNKESHKDYENQVAEYALALSAMGFPNVKTRIIYF